MDKIHARIQESVYTKAEWEAANPVLLKGEKGFVSDDPNLFKIGDGVTAWNSLPWRGYTGTIAQVTGDNENAVMSQKATVAAIKVETDRATAAEQANTQAIEEEKAAIMGTDRISPLAVTTEKLADKAITTEKLADSAMSKAMTKAISDEAQARAKADEGLNASIVAEKNRAMAAEKVNAKDIKANAEAIANETKRATTVEANISSEVSKKIDATNFNNQLQKKADKDDVAASLIALENKIGERTEITGDVVNNPDEEDLTQQNNKLMLKNRVYEPLNYSGKGYKILRKNMALISIPSATITVLSAPTTDGYISVIVDGVEMHISVTSADSIYDLCEKIASEIAGRFDKFTVTYTDTTVELIGNYEFTISDVAISAVDTGAEFGSTINDKIQKNVNLLTQDMITKENTIYVIRYDYELNNENITIPEGCMLKFDGGSLGNGALIGNFTRVEAGLVRIFKNDISISGTWNLSEVYSDWFNVDVSGLCDSSVALNKMLQFPCGNYIISKGIYKISNPIDSFKNKANINCSWAIFVPVAGITCFDFKYVNESNIKFDIVVRNFRIELAGDNIGVKIEANYFLYFYNFDIRCNNTEGNICILEKNNFNTSFRDGRLFGTLIENQRDILNTTNVGIKLTTDDTVSYNKQVSNLTFDNILIQYFETAVLIDYPTSVAQDEINFLNMGISFSGKAYHYKSGYTNSMIIGSRVTTCIKAFEVDMVRSLTIQDCYGISSGFLSVDNGVVSIEGLHNFFLTGSTQNKDLKQFLKTTNSSIIYWNGNVNYYGYTIDNDVAENTIIRNYLRGGLEVLLSGGIYSNLDTYRSFIKDSKGNIIGELVQNYNYLPKRTIPLGNTSFTVQDPFSNFIVQNDIASIKGNDINKIIKITTKSDKPVYIQLYNYLIIIEKYDVLFARCEAEDQWVLEYISRAQQTLITDSSNRPRNIDGLMVFDTTLGKPIWAYNGQWVDATGSTV